MTPCMVKATDWVIRGTQQTWHWCCQQHAQPPLSSFLTPVTGSTHLNHARKVSQVEQIVRLGWGGQQLGRCCTVHLCV